MTRREKIAWLAIGAVFVVGLLSLIPAHYKICGAVERVQNADCPVYQLVPFLIAKMVAFLDAAGSVITAAATIAIALFTLSLRRSTDKLWDAGERQLANLQNSSERQLRAYVFIEKTPIAESAGVFSVVFSVKNFGQTPAHNVIVEYAFEAVDCKDKTPVRIPDPDQNSCLGSIAPRTDFYELDAQLSGMSLDSLQRGEKAIYLVGSVTYDTVFTQGRITNFRYLVGGEIGWSGDTEMSADDEGNGAT